MMTVEQRPTDGAVKPTEMRFDEAVLRALEHEATRVGVSVSEYVRDAALARAAFAVKERDEGPDDLLTASASTLLSSKTEQARLATARQLIAALARAQLRERRDETAQRAKRRHVQRQANAVRARPSGILDAAARSVTDALTRRGFALAVPVAATFRTAEHNSTGIEVSVRLKEPAHAEAAKAAIVERIGGETRPDVIHVT